MQTHLPTAPCSAIHRLTCSSTTHRHSSTTRRLTDSSSFAFGRLRLAAMATRRSTRRQRTGHTARRQHQTSHEGGSCGSLQRRRNATLTCGSWLSRGAFLIGFPLRDLATLMAWRTTLASAPSLHARKNARTHSLTHAHTQCVCVRAHATAIQLRHFHRHCRNQHLGHDHQHKHKRQHHTNATTTITTHPPEFVKGAKQFYNVTIDYLGIQNEAGVPPPDDVVALRRGLDAAGLQHTLIVTPDTHDFSITSQLENHSSEAFDAIGVVGIVSARATACCCEQ
jgi:hypothetical protein